MVNQRTAFTNRKDFGKEAREAKWATEQRTLHGLKSGEAKLFLDRHHTFRDINQMAEEAKRRAEIASSALKIEETPFESITDEFY